MDKDKCYYCINSDVKYATIYCIQRTKERHKICDYIYSTVIDPFKLWFCCNARYQACCSAKSTGKNRNIGAKEVLWKILAWPLANQSITRKRDIDHKNTTISEILIEIDFISKSLNINLEYEMGIKKSIANSEPIKKILNAHNTGIYFTGFDNSSGRQGFKPLNGFFIGDIFDEPVDNKTIDIFDENKNKENRNNYDIFISTIEREDTDIKGKYLIYKDDYLPTYKVPIYPEWIINGKVILKKQFINIKMKKYFSRKLFSNPYKNKDWTYTDFINKYIPYNTHNISLLKQGFSLIYYNEEQSIFSMRAGLNINPYIKKERYKEIQELEDNSLKELLLYGCEYQGIYDSRYIYRADYQYTPSFNLNELKDFDNYVIQIDVGTTGGDQTVYTVIGEYSTYNNLIFTIKQGYIIKEIVYDSNKNKPLSAPERNKLLFNLIDNLYKISPNLQQYKSKLFIIFPPDGEWVKGYLEQWLKTKNYYTQIMIGITKGYHWDIIPRQFKLKAFLSSNRLFINKDITPNLHNDIFNCMKDPNNKQGKRYEKANLYNSLNTVELYMSLRLKYYNFEWFNSYIYERNKKTV